MYNNKETRASMQKSPQILPALKKSLRFVIVGSMNTFVAAIMLPIIYQAGLGLNLSFMISTLFTISFSFSTHRVLTFRSKAKVLAEYRRFFFNALFCSVFSYALLRFSFYIDLFEKNILYINVLVTGITAVISYLVHTLKTFRQNL